jgi:CubicO group peptidase (beta-lactamase class C family)
MKTPLTAAYFLVGSTIAIASVIAPTVFGQAQSTVTANLAESITARVDSLFAPWNRSDSPGCSLAISQNGAQVYERGYGMANLELGIAITPASVFNVGSISKTFTAMSILLLAQRGQLSLDDEVRKYITELPDYGSRLTLRHLLTHTSGLRSGFRLRELAEPRNDAVDGNDAFVAILARQRALNFTPGTEYEYSNSGYVLLAIVVKRVSGQSLREFADSNIFKPLGMTHTHFHDDSYMIVPNRAQGYYRGAGAFNVAFDYWNMNFGIGGNRGMVGGANLYTTARDLLIWEQNFVDVHLGEPALLAAMQTPAVLTSGETTSYGLGLELGLDRGLRTIGHNGTSSGYGARVVRYPDQGLTVALLCNLEGIGTTRLSQGIASIYLADALPAVAASSPGAVPTSVSLTAEQLASKVGLYRDPSNDALRQILVRDGKLRVVAGAGTGPGTELTPASANRFLLPGGTGALEFVPAVPSRPQEIHQISEGQKRVVFQQVNAFRPSSTELLAFTGEYMSPELDVTYTVVIRASGLVIEVPGRAEFLMRPTFTDAFQGVRVRVPEDNALQLQAVRFSRDASGVVTGFTVNAGDVRSLRFDRVKR